ncbi:hypothetical protein BS333_21490 (plasmid) [Vibrio azureus]|uniref:Uncharacterized protein n=1 Tax=Vibrio azureus NBRC 104587 TaxID=1219077 RepID=U3ASJ6_9VIBR|nr:hypothetical protein [Vibrio azureus]AUI88957.1 hypothetical protein BS333_21490 [Vibrio azureus]GAD76222.1 hypothetical protein VAZ01S_039_00470 [Vibrio azureus NBRC 104587]
MIGLLSLPHHGKVSQTIKTLKKRAPAPYHYVSVRGDWVCVYASQTAQPVRSEWWLDGLIEAGHLKENEPEDVAVLEWVNNQWQCTIIGEGRVRAIFDMGSEAILASRRFIVSGEDSEELTPQPDDIHLPAPSEASLATLVHYQCQRAKWRHPALLGGAGLIVIAACLAVGVYSLNQQDTLAEIQASTAPASNTVPITVPPWVKYRLAISNATSAHHLIEQAVYAASYLAMLPPDWRATELSQNGDTLTASIVREPKGLIRVFELWLDNHAELKPYLSGEPTSKVLTLPIHTLSASWREHVMPLRPTDQVLHDALILQDYEVSLVNTEISETWQSNTYEVKHPNASLLTLQHLATLLKSMPTSMDGLSLKSIDNNTWSLSFSITLYGGLQSEQAEQK